MSEKHTHLLWKNLGSEIVYDTRIFKLKRIQRLSPRGEEASFFQVAAPDWVTIIPELSGSGDKREFLVVRQYRHGNERVGMEFPAGTVDPGEEPLAAATRELLEETGYTASEWVKLSAVSPNPAFMSNKSYTFFARGLKKVADQDLDTYEYLDVHQATFSQLQDSIGSESYNSAITVQAWYFYLRHIGEIKC